MTEGNDEGNQSVANRVLAAFVTAIAEDKDLTEIAARLKPSLLDVDTPKEDAVRKALFGEGGA